MTDENEQSIPSRGSQVVAYAVIDDEGVQHSLWFLESDATSEAAMVGGTVVRLGSPTLTDEERTAIGLARSVFEDYKMSRLHSAADEVLERLLERTK
jgi:hypothetical protein